MTIWLALSNYWEVYLEETFIEPQVSTLGIKCNSLHIVKIWSRLALKTKLVVLEKVFLTLKRSSPCIQKCSDEHKLLENDTENFHRFYILLTFEILFGKTLFAVLSGKWNLFWGSRPNSERFCTIQKNWKWILQKKVLEVGSI